MRNDNNTIKTLFIIGILSLLIGSGIAMVKGEFDIVSIVFIIIGVILSGVFLIINREEIVNLFKNKAFRYGINAFIYSLLVIGIIVIIQAIFTVHSKQFDFTKNKRYTLSDQTRKILKRLDKDIEIYYFYSVKARNVQIEDKLRLYEKMTPKVKFYPVDADRNPAKAKRFNVDRYGIIVLYRKDNGDIQKVEDLTEQGITNGILKISRDKKKIIYFTKGHGEPSLDAPQNEKEGYSAVKSEIESENYIVKQIELFNEKEVPSDASILIIAGPKIDLFDREVELIKKYMNKGGNLLVLYQPFVKLKNLEALLNLYGIKPDNDVIVDKLSRMLGGDFLMPIISNYDYHDITKGFRVASFFPLCRSFEIKSGIKGLTIKSLAKTNPGSWGETNLNGIKKGQASFNAKIDKKAPLIVMAISEIDNSQFKADSKLNTNTSKAKLLVYGSSEFINNTYLGVSGNKDLFLNSINYLAEEKDLISIRPKEKSFEPLFLSKVQGRMLFTIPTIFLPLIVLSIGIMIFIRRKIS